MPMPQFLRHQGIYGFRRELLLQFVKWKPGVLERAEKRFEIHAGTRNDNGEDVKSGARDRAD